MAWEPYLAKEIIHMRTVSMRAQLRRPLLSAGLLGVVLALGFGLMGEAADHRDGPIFPNTAVERPGDLNDIYIFRSPGGPCPTTDDFGNTVLAITLSPFPGVLTPTSFDPRVTVDLNVVNITGHLTPDMTFRFTFGPQRPPAIPSIRW